MIAENGLNLLLGIANRRAAIPARAVHCLLLLGVWRPASAVHLHRIIRRIAGDYAERLMVVTGKVIRGTVYGLLGTAVVQGMLTAFGLWLTGVPRPVLLGAIAGFVSVLPIGAPMIWIPAAGWLFSNGHLGWAVFLVRLRRGRGIRCGQRDPAVSSSPGARNCPSCSRCWACSAARLAFGLLGIFLGPVLLGVGFTLVTEFAAR